MRDRADPIQAPGRIDQRELARQEHVVPVGKIGNLFDVDGPAGLGNLAIVLAE